MRTLFLGLVLASAPALATPVQDCQFCFGGMNFGIYVHPVTVENTPEWAQVPDAQAWYELQLGILTGRWDGMQLVLRGVLFLENRPRAEMWLEIIPIVTQGGLEEPHNDTPEPHTWLFVALGGSVLSLRRRRTRAGGDGAGRRRSWST